VVTALGSADEPAVRELLGEADMLATAMEQTTRRVARGIASGFFPESAGSMLRLYRGMALSRRAMIAVEIVGQDAVAWSPGEAGVDFVQRQARSIGGGTTEMARNIISKRLLGMPREPAADRDLPFNQVRRA
jgi:alkylation response protein AidB-like acyl-CoA dehydrogenase